MPKPITADRLKLLGACPNQVRRFRELFGDGAAPLTVETAVEYAQEFDWHWAADNLLTPAARAVYDEAVAPVRAAYCETLATASAAYIEAETSARAAYRETLAVAPVAFDEARAAYDEAEATARAAYHEVVDPASAAYRKALAKAFAEAYLAHPGGATAPIID